MDRKHALLLVNMGGPSSSDEVAPYMAAIFRDPFILPVPGLLRGFVGNMIVRKRTDSVIEKYNLIGGKSPLLTWTEMQTDLLRKAVGERFDTVKHAYRYSPPLIGDALRELHEAGYGEVTLLPLFPHYTRAMSGSIEVEAKRHAEKLGLTLYTIPAFGLHERLLELQAAYLHKGMREAGDGARVIFVAHGIPLRDVKRGDTYPEQVRENAVRLAATLPEGTDWTLAYQSRVGPVAWTGPYLEDELERFAASSNPVVIMPLSFVADCLETLYDLDIEAAPELRTAGVEKVVRVPAYNDDPRFADVLSEIVGETVDA